MPDVCDSRKVTAPDGREIPIPLGELSIGADPKTGEDKWVNVSAEADARISVSDAGQYYVAVNAAGPSNDEAKDLFVELVTETSIRTLENLAEKAFTEAAASGLVEVGIGAALAGPVGLVAGVLISLFSSSNLTREIFIRGNLSDDNTPVTYCLLVDGEE